MNISSPNTPGLRDLQGAESLERLLGELVNARESLSGVHGNRVPLLVKIAPDLDEAGLHSIGACFAVGRRWRGRDQHYDDASRIARSPHAKRPAV